MIGTTDNKCEYDENIKAKDEEIKYLLDEVNIYFTKPLKKEDILSSWSGIRPLIKSANKSNTQEIVREHLIISSKNGLISIAGGKWTTYRKMAQDMMDFLVDKNYLEKENHVKQKSINWLEMKKNIKI